MLKSAFVYGTLMVGFRNYMKLLDEKLIEIEPATTKGTLFHLPKYDCPGLLDGDETVHGEFLSYDDDENDSIENAIDALETAYSTDGLLSYEKVEQDIVVNGRNVTTELYKMIDNEQIEKVHVENGDWRVFIFESEEEKS